MRLAPPTLLAKPSFRLAKPLRRNSHKLATSNPSTKKTASVCSHLGPLQELGSLALLPEVRDTHADQVFHRHDVTVGDVYTADMDLNAFSR